MAIFLETNSIVIYLLALNHHSDRIAWYNYDIFIKNEPEANQLYNN